tara:strand:- start:11 stop:358 length:348 start_codon:yes stop_codon:yes gene_type:complete
MINTSLLWLKMHHPDKRKFIQRIQQILSIDKPTLSDFQDTGLMMNRQSFESSCDPNQMDDIQLRHNCTDVIWYAMTWQIVECLDSGYFVGDANGKSKRSKTLDVVEQFLFKNETK